MAGMLPGVECARRRRFHQSITSSDSASTAAKLGSTRRSSFCLYTSNRDFHLTSSSSQQRCSSNHAYQNEKLGQAAREAKERLDERLRTHRKPENSRKKSSSEEVGLKKEKAKGKEETTTKKRFSWGKLMKWKASEQEECTVCLERFRAVEPLVHLPCAHKFHSTCLVPWLQANAHCPCCRYPILAQ
ncbi:probable E3 ubiquitin-protein ligase RHY1A [Cucurbita pepo subsp. pepo]|uniref:probable E3 ubiquitin-protein ligase RHY1A n=1 Tax=Cucurbita pepo subsp. pepo TaxID=3664 RepID=UPI000C9D7A60|nr:probable E3 ubiquitin-protein ligase RHY1A [Cucurbita pepo subsp. pepo]